MYVVWESCRLMVGNFSSPGYFLYRLTNLPSKELYWVNSDEMVKQSIQSEKVFKPKSVGTVLAVRLLHFVH